MGKRGPKPKPTAAKILGGETRPSRVNYDEPAVDADMPTMPRGVLLHEAQRMWRANVEALNAAGILKKTDGPAYALMCQHYGLAMAASKILVEEGLTTVDERGLTRKHPIHTVLMANSAAFARYAAQFGMTPSARATLRVAEGGEQMTLAEILFAAVQEAEVD